jgi:dsRNA-specific ribonuclease
MLQEYMQKFSKHDIVYKTVNNQNGDYWVEVWINNIKKGIGHGVKIKEAQVQAARDAYKKLTKGK